MKGEPLDRFLALLENVRKIGDSYTALCPAHEDTNPSLSVSLGRDGKVLVRCHANCPLDKICDAVGVSVSDLFPKKRAKSKRGRTSDTYDYRDETGNLLFQTVRYIPKDFRQRQPMEGGGWKWNLNGVRRIPYRLPELIAAPIDQWVFVVEGEKDADNVAKEGLIATTCPMGAGKWKHLDDDSALENRRVAIIADNDEPGRSHAADVAKRLSGRAAEIRIIELPGEGKDASDWLANGGTKEQLLALVEQATIYKSSTGESPAEADEGEVKESAGLGYSQATQLVNLTEDLTLFFDGEDAYAAITLPNGGREVLSIRSKKFKRYLCRCFYEQFGRAPSSQAMADALTTIEGKALFEGPEHKVHVRLAEIDGVIYLDLADAKRRIVTIEKGRWSVTQDAPVFFRRPKGLSALPMPVKGGSLRELKSLLNLKCEDDFVLLIAWLVAAMRPERPMPVLALSSEQGSGKSTATRILRMLIDPNVALIRSAPRDVRDLMIAANNSLVVALDNLSRIPDWLSDAICRLSTGGGLSTRTLYENDEEQLFNVLRPVILNGIEELGSRSDLLERSIRVSFPTILEEKRQTEKQLYAKFHAAHPQLLGALCDAVSVALKQADSVNFDRLPRMADFASWVVAAEPALPWEVGDFMRAYWRNCESVHDVALESSPVGEAVLAFAEANAPWTGKASELLELLYGCVPDSVRMQPGWPKRPNNLSGALKRIAPNLRANGVVVEFPDRTRKGRTLIIRKLSQNCVTSVTDRHGGHSEPATRDCRDAPAGNCDAAVTQEHDAETPAVTQRDAGDAEMQRVSSPTCRGSGHSDIQDREVADL